MSTVSKFFIATATLFAIAIIAYIAITLKASYTTKKYARHSEVFFEEYSDYFTSEVPEGKFPIKKFEEFAKDDVVGVCTMAVLIAGSHYQSIGDIDKAKDFIKNSNKGCNMDINTYDLINFMIGNAVDNGKSHPLRHLIMEREALKLIDGGNMSDAKKILDAIISDPNANAHTKEGAKIVISYVEWQLNHKDRKGSNKNDAQ